MARDTLNGISIEEPCDWTLYSGHVLTRGERRYLYKASIQQFRPIRHPHPIPIGRLHTPGLDVDPTVSRNHAILGLGELHVLTNRGTTTLDGIEREPNAAETPYRVPYDAIIGIGATARFRNWFTDLHRLMPFGTLEPIVGPAYIPRSLTVAACPEFVEAYRRRANLLIADALRQGIEDLGHPLYREADEAALMYRDWAAVDLNALTDTPSESDSSQNPTPPPPPTAR